jgi:hypothetical protein
LSDELEHTITSGAAAISGGGVGCLGGSLLLELFEDVGSRGLHVRWLEHPRMRFQLFDGWSFRSIIAEHFENEVLELW